MNRFINPSHYSILSARSERTIHYSLSPSLHFVVCKMRRFHPIFQLSRRLQSSVAKIKLNEILESRLDGIKKAGTWKAERIITSSQTINISVKNSTNKVMNFCANNYLGLSDNSEVVDAGKIAMDRYGSGLSSVRFICGTQEIHKELESKISHFHNRQDAILYASCFDANAGVFEALLTPDDAIFSDTLNHASIIDGIRLCKAKKFRYKHRDMAELESMLKTSDARLKLIVTDGVFSMDGTIAPLIEIVDLAQKYSALTFIDECHATGFFGETGRGTEEYMNVMGKIDIINSTLGKALGGAMGGYTTGTKPLIDLLRQVSRPYLFSNSLPPSVVGSAIKVFDLIESSPGLCQKLRENTTLFRKTMTEAGFKISGKDHPICPVMIGDAKLANELANKMLREGIYVIGFSYPVVPEGAARVRVQISAAHGTDQIMTAVSAFKKIGKELNIIQ
ncbi:glycine C-acetyltransferase [Arctopsyche grandis]|uniref:glycine C-acetyltransferase n=1 Tax=Arctopsyche grandis TaxID=121162 RepID=UPI00406D956F